MIYIISYLELKVVTKLTKHQCRKYATWHMFFIRYSRSYAIDKQSFTQQVQM
jgi:hypothetical protein